MQTENIISTLDSKLTPAAVMQGKPDALRVGQDTAAVTLFETFSQDAIDNTKIKVICELASNLTCEQFKEKCKAALELAKQTDAASGFFAEVGATGRNLYGPIQNVLVQRLSEAKQIFGAYKQDKKLVSEKGYAPALASARAFFKQTGKRWDGVAKATQEGKEDKARIKVIADIMGKNPNMPLEQIQQLATATLELEASKALTEKAQKIAEGIIEKHGEGMLMALVQWVIDTADADGLQQLTTYVNDATTILTLEQERQAQG